MSANGNGTIAKIGQSLISALPPAFLLLVLINVIFIGVTMWFLDDQMAQRTHMAEQLFDRCLDIALRAPTKP